MSSDDFKSFITAVFLSALVVLGFNYFFPQPKAETETAAIEEAQTPVAEEMPVANDTSVTIYAPVDEVLKQDERLKISNRPR